jgi:hypothetical protein
MATAVARIGTADTRDATAQSGTIAPWWSRYRATAPGGIGRAKVVQVRGRGGLTERSR